MTLDPLTDKMPSPNKRRKKDKGSAKETAENSYTTAYDLHPIDQPGQLFLAQNTENSASSPSLSLTAINIKAKVQL